MTTSSSPFSSPFTRTYGDQCPTCHGTGFKPLVIGTGKTVATSQLERQPCDNPNCTVNRRSAKRTPAQWYAVERENKAIDEARVLVSGAPDGKRYELSCLVTVRDVTADALTDAAFEAAHQVFRGACKAMKIHTITLANVDYSFSGAECPKCGHLTTEIKDIPMTPPANNVLDTIFDPTASDEEADAAIAALKDAPLDLTGSPDVKTATVAPKVDTDKLKMTLFNRIATGLNCEKESAILHLRTALKADTLADYLKDHTPEQAEQTVDEYISRNMRKGTPPPPEQPASPPPPAIVTKSYELDEAAIRTKYTIKMKRGSVFVDYLQVQGRVLLFRIKHRNGEIRTTMLHMDDRGALFRAEVFTAEGKPLASGHGFAGFAGAEKFSGRICEKAETAAIGRALAAAGFGTDAAGDDLDEDDHLADSPVAQTTTVRDMKATTLDNLAKRVQEDRQATAAIITTGAANHVN